MAGGLVALGGSIVGVAVSPTPDVGPFPNGAPLALGVELYLNNAWVDVTGDVYERDGVVLSRGRSNEAGAPEPATCSLTLDNRSGDYSTRNPLSPYYGSLGRATPIRVFIDGAEGRVQLTGTVNSYYATSDKADVSITGDIDIRVDAWLPDWGTYSSFVYKWSSPNRSYYLSVENGYPNISWSTDGTTINALTASEPVHGAITGRKVLRATLDVDNGAGGHTAQFYVGESTDGPWYEVGEAQVGTGTTSIYDGTATLFVYCNGTTAEIFEFQLRDGIDGTVVANPIFSDEPSGTSAFSDGFGNTWSKGADATFSARDYRYYGEVGAWPLRWHPSGEDVWVPVEAGGLLRRLGAGQQPLASSMRRATLDPTGTLAGTLPTMYWPCEDGSDSTSFAPARGSRIGTMSNPATITLANYAGFDCSGPLPTINSGSSATFSVTGTTDNAAQSVRLLLAIPEGGFTNGRVLFDVSLTEAISTVAVLYNTGGNLTVRATYATGTTTDHVWGFGLNPGNYMFLLTLDANLGDVDYGIWTWEVQGTDAAGGGTDTFTSSDVGRITRVRVSPTANNDNLSFGHVAVFDDEINIYDISDATRAYRGETAANRIDRLCEENGIDFLCLGDSGDSEPMGAQRVATLLELLTECADADMGVLYDSRRALRLEYRTRSSLLRQWPVLELRYEGYSELTSLDPDDDDKDLANVVTVTRTNGGTRTEEQTEGPFNTEAFPAGVGVYAIENTVNVYSDEQLPDQAGWRLSLGTVDEARWSRLVLNMGSQVLAAKWLLVNALDVGDRVTVSELPAWVGPNDASQLVQGYMETLNSFTRVVSINTSPESPYRVGRYDYVDDDDGASRYSPDTCTLDSSATSTETSLSVASSPIWSTDAGDYPLRLLVGGEVVEVTAVSGSSSPQTFTVTRSQNGVVKAHAAGTAVELFQPARYAI